MEDTLSYNEVEFLIYEISNALKYVHVDNINKLLVFKHVTGEKKVKASSIYEVKFNEFLNSGLLLKADLEKVLVNRGVITDNDYNNVHRLKMQIKAQETVLSKTIKSKLKTKNNRLYKVINKLKNDLEEAQYKIDSKLALSVESRAQEYYNNYLCWMSVFNEDGSNYWNTFDEFMESSDYDTRNEILYKFLKFKNGIPTLKIRYIARSSLWRTIYNSSIKTSDPLFGIPSSYYSVDQINLVYWSEFYDRVYNMPPEDLPDDHIIEDDDALDIYMDEYYKNLKNDIKLLKNKRNSFSKGRSALESDEVIITQSSELYHEIEYDKPREAQKSKNINNIKANNKN